MTTNGCTRAVLYSRFSPQPKKKMEGKGVGDQFSLCRAFCESESLEVIGEYSDLGIGRSEDYDKRPGLWQAVREARKGVALVAYRRDRLGAGVMMFLIERDVTKHGGKILTVEGSDNGDSAEAQLLNGIMACVSEYERLVIASRTRALMLAKQASGHRISGVGKEPYGYMTDPQDQTRLIEHPDERVVINEILDLTEQGVRPYTISKRLYEQGHRSRGSTGRFRPSTIEAVVKRESARYAQ